MSPEEIKELIENKFFALLTEAGTDIDAPDLFLTWEAFKAFAQTRVEQTHGGLLFECGPVNWGEGDFFEVSFLRLFYLEVEESWDDLMVQVGFNFAPIPELNQFKVSIDMDWGMPSEVTAFIHGAESHHTLWEALQKYPVHHCSVRIGPQ